MEEGSNSPWREIVSSIVCCVGCGGLVSVWDVSKAKSQCFVVREPLYYNKLNSQECS